MKSDETKIMRLYHYCPAIYIPKIVATGQINTTTSLMAIKEIGFVWLSSNPVWEVTANKMIKYETSEFGQTGFRQLNNEEMKMLFGFGRIEVMPSPFNMPWKELRRAGFIHHLIADKAEQVGNPEEWYARPNPIPRAEWLSIEVMMNGHDEWDDVSMNNEIFK